MAESRDQERVGRGENINLRATSKQEALIDQAAETLGRTSSDFVLDAVCREAETVLPDRCCFALSGDAFKCFSALLDQSPAENLNLGRLLKTKAPGINESGCLVCRGATDFSENQASP